MCSDGRRDGIVQKVVKQLRFCADVARHVVQAGPLEQSNERRVHGILGRSVSGLDERHVEGVKQEIGEALATTSKVTSNSCGNAPGNLGEGFVSGLHASKCVMHFASVSLNVSTSLPTASSWLADTATLLPWAEARRCGGVEQRKLSARPSSVAHRLPAAWLRSRSRMASR